MNKQQMFNRVADHLLAQNDRSLNSNGDCVYRGSHGRKCAIGCLIPDELYDPSIEGHGVDIITAENHKIAAIIPDFALPLAGELQALHDNYTPEVWRDELAGLAFKHGLDWHPPASPLSPNLMTCNP